MNAPFDVCTVTLNPAIDRTVTISNFAAGEVNRAEAVRSHPGGKGVNVACALADAGHRVAVTGFLGRENAGVFEQLFAQKDLADRFVRIAGETRIGIKITDPALGQTTDINFAGATPGAPDLGTLQARLAELGGPRWCVLAGSLPPGLPVSIYRELAAQAKARGSRVALDTSGDALSEALPAEPDLIKPNVQELEALLGRALPDRAAVVEAARHLVAQGVGLVIVSMGADGAVFVEADEAVVALPPRDTVVLSTVGAGDAMVAGTVAGRLRGYSLADTARLATCFSLDVLARLEPGLSSLAAIERAKPRVTVTAV